MNIPESHGQDTDTHYNSPPECNIQPQDELETIPEEEEPQMEEKQDLADQDTVEFIPDESEEEPFNTLHPSNVPSYGNSMSVIFQDRNVLKNQKCLIFE